MTERPTSSTATSAQLAQGLRLIRLAIAGSIAFIAAGTIAFLAASDVGTVPLVPIAVAVIVFDLVFLTVFSRFREQEIRRAQARESGLEPDD